MPRSTPNDRPTRVIVTAGEILRTLHPSLLRALIVVYNDNSLSQAEVAEIVGRTQPTVSSYFKSLEEGLQVPLTRKRGQRNTVTKTGEKVIGLIRRMFINLDPDLSSIDWKDETDRAVVSARLSPLHDSRSTEPFFILDSLYSRSDIDGILGKPQPVWFDDVVDDVKHRQKEREKNTTATQVRDKIKRFDDADALTFDIDKGQITLIEKGQEQGRLLTELIKFLTKQDHIDTDSSETTENSTESLDNRDVVRELDDSPNQTHTLGSITQQRQGQGFLGVRRSSGTGQLFVQDQPTVVLTYCLHSTDENTNRGSDSQPLPVLRLSVQTVNELADRIEQVIQECGGDTQLVPYWALQTDTGLYPLGPAGIPPAEW